MCCHACSIPWPSADGPDAAKPSTARSVDASRARVCVPPPSMPMWKRIAVDRAGFNGFNEVEIFSLDRWNSDQNDYLSSIIRAYRERS